MAHVDFKASVASEMMQMGSGMGREVARGTTKIVVISGSSKAGNRVIGKLVRHPLIIIGLGFAAGYLIHKYRNEIISSASKSRQ